MSSTINIQLTDQLRRFVDSRTSDDDVYSTPSEYLRDLIRRDMEQRKKLYDIEVAEMLVNASKSKTAPMEKDFIKKELQELKKYSAGLRKKKRA